MPECTPETKLNRITDKNLLNTNSFIQKKLKNSKELKNLVATIVSFKQFAYNKKDERMLNRSLAYKRNSRNSRTANGSVAEVFLSSAKF